MSITTCSTKRGKRGVVTVSVIGDIDAYTAPKVRSGLRSAITDPHTTHLHVDLADVFFLDSSGVDALIRCRTEAESRGIQFDVINPQAHPRKVLTMFGLTEFLADSPHRTSRPGLRRAGPGRTR